MRTLSYALLILGTVTFSSCTLNKMLKMAKDQELTVTPDPLELHNDRVKFDVSAKLPEKMMKKGFVYSIESRYEYAGQELKLENLDISGDDASTSKTVSREFAYQEGMEKGVLVAEGYAIKSSNQKRKGPTDQMEVVRGLITTSKLVEKPAYGAYVSYDYKDETVGGWTPDEELEPTNIAFYFEQGRHVLRTSEKRSDRGKYFSAFIAEKNVTRTVTITGTHSPEGPERINSKLSENRAEVIENFYVENMKKYDYKGEADEIKFVLKPVIEDWTDFKKHLEEYDGISSSEKSQVLTIVNGSGSFEDKENQISKLPFYKKLFNDIYPELRAARTEILTVMPKRSAAEISVLAKQIVEGKLPADTLSYGELAYAAYLTPSAKEKVAIYEATIKTYDNWAAHNNLGAAYMEEVAQGEGDANTNREKAVTQFELSNRKKANAYAKANLGVAEYLQGNTDKGLSEINEAMGMNLPSNVVYGFNGVKGAIEIEKAMYSDAVKSLSNATDNAVNLYNKALAQVLSKDYENALITLDELADKDSENAKGHYLAAIAAARMGNAQKAVESIGKSVAIDSSLKQKALDDLEFRALASNEAFRTALR
ncbi:MAG: tetratricopeptide repeat protein [Cyclobacteriaceae bacterium]